jgi:RNAse (barnase) inhibitor barstar
MARTLTIDCGGVRTEAAFWQRYLDAAEPEEGGFGGNLDAFWDALAGGPGWPGDVDLKFVNTAGLAALRDGQFIAALKKIAADVTFMSVSFT